MKIAFVHDWLLGMRGGEKVLEAACELFPGSDIYTLLHDPSRVSERINRGVRRASWLQRLPGIKRYYRYLLPVMPRVIESFDLSGYDLVISFSHCVAKGAHIEGRGASGARPIHICYCFTPMRYIYYQFDNYFPNGANGFSKRAAQWFRPYLTRWDRETTRNVDHFVAISENVRRRIQNTYGRESELIYPPVDTDFFTPFPDSLRQVPSDYSSKGGPGKARGEENAPYYLVAGALVPYKRVDLAIAACRQLDVPLKIVGVGTEEKRLRGLAQNFFGTLSRAAGEGGVRVEFLGWQGREALRDLYRGCEALLFPQEEDFGIAAVEAMACGKPVIAYGAGGALETVEDGKTGVLFGAQTPEALAEAIRKAQSIQFNPEVLREDAERFGQAKFKKQLSDFVRKVVSGKNTDHASSRRPREGDIVIPTVCGRESNPGLPSSETSPRTPDGIYPPSAAGKDVQPLPAAAVPDAVPGATSRVRLEYYGNDARIRVMQVVECGGAGGTGYQVAALCNGLDKNRFDVSLVYAVRPGNSPEEFEELASGAERRIHLPEMVREITPWSDLQAFRRLYEIFREYKPQIVHAHSSKAGFLARIAGRLAGVPHIYYSAHGYSFLQTDRSRLSRGFYRFLERFASRIGGVVAVSDSEAAFAREVGAKRVTVVRDAYLGEISKEGVRGEGSGMGQLGGWREERGEGKETLVCAAGRISFPRNPQAFVRLAQRLTDSRNGLRCLWIGGGELQPQMEEMIRDMNLTGKLRVTGWLPHDAALAHLQTADIFVHFSRWEGLPNAVLEAMAYGLPVVASNIPGNRNLIRDGENGFLVDSEVELLERVLELVDHRDLRGKLGAKGRSLVQAEYSLERMLDEMSALYAA